MELCSYTGKDAPRVWRRWRTAVVLVCTFCQLGAASLSDTGEIQELLPTDARWQFYPTYVKSVKFDNSGRPWFVIDRRRNLWFYGPGPDHYRLYHVQLPDN